MAVSEQSLIVSKGGRPLLYGEPTSSVSTSIPVSYHDRLVKLANLHELSVSQLVSKVLMRAVDRAIE